MDSPLFFPVIAFFLLVLGIVFYRGSGFVSKGPRLLFSVGSVLLLIVLGWMNLRYVADVAPEVMERSQTGLTLKARSHSGFGAFALFPLVGIVLWYFAIRRFQKRKR